MNIIAIIPARYNSSRFPGKPLIDIDGKTMIQRVYEQASKAVEDVVVATDDKRIFDAVKSFGGEVVITSTNHKTGTDRCVEALEVFSAEKNKKFDTIINIQGDEPLVSPLAIKNLAELFENKEVKIGTLVNKHAFSERLNNPNRIKVTIDKNNKAIAFSRSLIPFVRNTELLKNVSFYSHIGIYAFRCEVLKEVAKLKMSMLEMAESLEQNRWIENGYSVHVHVTDYQSVSVDSPEDLDLILELL